jgi:hypothetical protein
MYVVVDDFAGGAPELVCDRFERALAVARARSSLDPTEVARVALGEAGAQLAAVVLEAERAVLVRAGTTRIYRSRGASLEVLTAPAPTLEPGREHAIEIGAHTVEPGDTFILTTDGYHRRADPDPVRSRADPSAFFACESVAAIVRVLIEQGQQLDDDDVAVLAVRVPRPDLRAGLDERVQRALDEWTPGTLLRLKAVRLRFPANPPGIARGFPRLVLAMTCDARRGRGPAHADAEAFVAALREYAPELGGPHEWSLEPAIEEDPTSIEARIAVARSLAEKMLERARGLSIGPITPRAAWGEARHTLEVLVVRDDVDGAGSEDAAARRVARELARHAAVVGPTSARGEYCK